MSGYGTQDAKLDALLLRALMLEGEERDEYLAELRETQPATHERLLHLLELAERPVGMLMNNCPEGDVTGATIAACTVWKGIVYGIDEATGHVDLLPPEGADAPDALLLPGFGPAVLSSSVGKGLEAGPWDVFEFKGCTS